MNNKVRQFLRLDLGTVVFGVVYFIVTNFIGYEQSVTNSTIVSVIFWVLMLFVLGFMGKFRED